MSKKVKVVQSEEKSKVPTEILVDSIIDISVGFRNLMKGKMTKKLITLLIHDMTKVSKTDIEKVIDALPDLEKRYLK